ncbi:MAG TPA: hypothetical protein VFF65_08850 [Phycisphaerales bacterium]|nr:hypothetical protein [Phycisphaerales bacterium]
MPPEPPPLPDPLELSFVMHVSDVLRIRGEVARYFDGYAPPEGRHGRAVGVGVVGLLVALVAWAFVSAVGIDLPEQLLLPLAILAGTAYFVRAQYKGRVRRTLADGTVVSRPLTVDELDLLGSHRVSIDASGCTVTMPNATLHYPAFRFDAVRRTGGAVAVALLPRNVFVIPLTVFGSDEAADRFSARAADIFLRSRDPAAYVRRLMAGDAVPCPACGYDMHGAQNVVCPECGKEVTIDALLARDRAMSRPA